jgi:nitroreductase/NAD-dependent dihydropyrimidine dehydrogenase PreA subunit
MKKNIRVSIAISPCTGCGACIDVCPFKNLSLVDEKADFKCETCISCGHCAAACQQGAIRVQAVDDEMGDYKTFASDKKWLPHGQYDTTSLVRLMGSRRSCRNFTGKPVDRPLLDDLVKIGITAPSGTNCQLWTFTILPTREAVMCFSRHIAAFFQKLNAMAEKRLLRTMLKLVGKKELDDYFRAYYPIVKKTLEDWKETGKDRLFHGASSTIIVGMKPGASCPAEDAMLATQNILLAAHSMGLGSCLIGFAVSAMNESSEIKRSIGIPEAETVYAVIALGYPDESYETVAGRKRPVMRYFEG